MTNQEIAQEINNRIGNAPIPFDSVYSIAFDIYQELGGEGTDFDSVYSILLATLPLIEGGVASKVIDDTIVSTGKTWSSEKINSEISAIAGTANPEIEGKETEDFRFVNVLPESGETDEQVIIKGENTDTLYKYTSGEWAEQTPDATKLYFDIENEALYSYVTAQHQFAPISLVNTIIVGSNLNSNADLKALKTVGVYSVVQRLHHSTKGDYIKNWTLYVESVDYEEYDKSDSVYQRLVSNYTIQKRTWSATRVSNDGWSNFATYYAGEIKDSTTSKYYTWSSNKLTSELAAKVNISDEGYVFDTTSGGFAEKYKQDASDGGQIVVNTASGLGSHAEGYKTTASGDYGSHAEGTSTKATAAVSHAEGNRCEATGMISHAEGNMTKATNQSAHSEGRNTLASGSASHAEGIDTVASGDYSHAEGQGGANEKSIASGKGSHVEGFITKAQNFAEHAEGTGNVSHKTVIDDENNFGSSGNTIHSVGIGRYVNNRKNAVEIMQNGDMYIKGVGGYDGVHIKNESTGVTVQSFQEYVTNLETTVGNKQDELVAGTNITISGTTISAVYETATTADIEALFA